MSREAIENLIKSIEALECPAEYNGVFRNGYYAGIVAAVDILRQSPALPAAREVESLKEIQRCANSNLQHYYKLYIQALEATINLGAFLYKLVQDEIDKTLIVTAHQNNLSNSEDKQ